MILQFVFPGTFASLLLFTGYSVIIKHLFAMCKGQTMVTFIFLSLILLYG